MTKSPPTKRVKEHHVEDMDTDPLDIVKQKDVEIMDLKSTISQLKQKLQNFEDSMAKTKIHLEYTFKCEKCNKQFKIKNDMLDHMKEHIVHKEMAPVDTTIISSDKKNIQNKVLFSEIYNCEKCGKVFKNKPLLKEHHIKYHKETPMATAHVGNVPCVCVYPCIPVEIRGEVQMAAPRGVDETQVSEHTPQVQEGSGEQPETWGRQEDPSAPYVEKLATLLVQ